MPSIKSLALHEARPTDKAVAELKVKWIQIEINVTVTFRLPVLPVHLLNKVKTSLFFHPVSLGN